MHCNQAGSAFAFPMPLSALHVNLKILCISMSADGLVGATSNLALKGIMGIYSMGMINKALEPNGADPEKTSHLLVSSHTFLKSWVHLSEDRLMMTITEYSAELRTTMAKTRSVIGSCYVCIWEQRFLGITVQPLRAEVDWSRYHFKRCTCFRCSLT